MTWVVKRISQSGVMAGEHGQKQQQHQWHYKRNFSILRCYC